MKTKIGVVILVIVSIGLAVALILSKKQSDALHKQDADTISDFSNQLIVVNGTLQEQRQVNLELTNEIASSQQQSLTLSNDLTDVKSSLATAQDKITGLNGQVTDLEARNQELDQNLITLSNTIGSLSAQIADAEAKLSTSETNNAFLTTELQKQIAQRADLEKKFNDLSALRAQVKKVKTEAFVNQRLDWIRQGIDPSQSVKGGQILTQHAPATTATVKQPNYNLNVEVGSDGAVRIIPDSTTNAPAATTNSP